MRDESGQEPETREGSDDALHESSQTSEDSAPDPLTQLRFEAEQADKRARETEARLRTVSKAYSDLESEMDSFRRRMNHQADQRVERKQAELVEQFFDPVQNLKRSIEAGKGDPVAVMEGLEMIAQQFADVLTRLGLEEIPGVGSQFDPTVHEALAVAPVTDPAQDGKVLMVHATGYRLGGKVLQPAQVVIGKYGVIPEA